MKKHLRKFLCAVMCLMIMLSGVNVFASETRTFDDIKWRGDYSSNSKPKLIITVTTPVEYVQQVTAVVYDSSKTTPTLADYIRITHARVDEKGTKDITFTITNNFSNEVKVDLKGNGYDVTEGSATVNVIKPSAIDGLLARFNDESDTTIRGALSEADLALQLGFSDENSDRVTRRIEIMKNIKANDLKAPFATLEDVRFAWQMSDIIAYIEDSGSTASGLKSLIDENSEYIDVDRTNPDYTAYIDSVCGDILNYVSEYNDNKGIKCAKDLEGIINQYVGLRAVNAATAETIHSVFGDYNQYFEIPADVLSKYNNPDFGRSNQDKALRAIFNDGVNNHGFVKNSDLRKAFVDAMNGIPLPEGGEEGSQQGYGNETASMLVDEIDYVYEDDQELKRVSGYMDGTYSSMIEYQPGDIPDDIKHGDLVRLALLDNRVTKVQVSISAEEFANKATKVVGTGTQGSIRSEVFAPLYSVSSYGIAVLTPNAWKNTYGPILTAGRGSGITVNVTVYDVTNDEMYKSSINDVYQIYTANAKGEMSGANDVMIYMRMRYETIREIVLVRY